MNKYQLSMIIGLWRMGNPETVIAALSGCSLWEVERSIKLYQGKY